MLDLHDEKWVPVLTGEILLFGLLGKAIYAELDRDWLDSLVKDEVFSESPLEYGHELVNQGLEDLQSWARQNPAGLSDEEFKTIRSDHLNLFVGIDKVLAPVWASVYFSEKRLVFQEETLKVREWYARYGLQIERLNREPDDHIGLELSFLAHLSALALKYFHEKNTGAFEEVIGAQKTFLGEHLLRWGPSWSKLVNKHANTLYYKGLAKLIHGALLSIADHRSVPLPKEVSL